MIANIYMYAEAAAIAGSRLIFNGQAGFPFLPDTYGGFQPC